MKCSRLSLIVFDADCTQIFYKVPAFEKELPSAVADIHNITELVVELAQRMCRKDLVFHGEPH